MTARTPPVFAQRNGNNARHHCKHIMGITFGPRSLLRRYVYLSRCLGSYDHIRHKGPPTSQDKRQSWSVRQVGSNDALYVDQIIHQS